MAFEIKIPKTVNVVGNKVIATAQFKITSPITDDLMLILGVPNEVPQIDAGVYPPPSVTVWINGIELPRYQDVSPYGRVDVYDVHRTFRYDNLGIFFSRNRLNRAPIPGFLVFYPGQVIDIRAEYTLPGVTPPTEEPTVEIPKIPKEAIIGGVIALIGLGAIILISRRK